MAAEPADLKLFLESAGRSLEGAQGALAGASLDAPMKVAISDAELEVKALVQTTAAGTLSIMPVSAQDVTAGRITPGALSTVKIRYVAIADDASPVASAAAQRSADAVIADVKRRPDVASLDDILGGLRYEAAFVASTRRWLVTAFDPAGRTVREAVIADAPSTVKPRPG